MPPPKRIKVVNIRDVRAWTPRHVYIGRGSKWGNPYRIGPDGTREDVLRQYREFLIRSPGLLQEVPALRGKILVCYCAPKGCHGDILKLFAERKEES